MAMILIVIIIIIIIITNYLLDACILCFNITVSQRFQPSQLKKGGLRTGIAAPMSRCERLAPR